MIDDRDYMRQPEFGGSRWPRRFGVQWSLTVGFLIAYALVFMAQQVPQTSAFFGNYLALSNAGLAHGYVWQLVTYQFLHANFLHILFNGWAIYVFGTALESELGRGRFVALMLSSGIVGGVFQALLAWLAPRFFSDTAQVVGASACAFGLVAAYALLFPTRELTMLVLYIIPVTVAARTLLLVSVALALIGVAMGVFYPAKSSNQPMVAYAAHLGGMLMGWIFVTSILRRDWSTLSQLFRPAKKSQPSRPKLEPLEPRVEADFLQNQVDAILDKISAHGIQSLTTREREILESARKKMTKS